MMCPGWKKQLQCSASLSATTTSGVLSGCTRWWFWIAAGVAAFAGARKGNRSK